MMMTMMVIRTPVLLRMMVATVRVRVRVSRGWTFVVMLVMITPLVFMAIMLTLRPRVKVIAVMMIMVVAVPFTFMTTSVSSDHGIVFGHPIMIVVMVLPS